MPPRQRRMRRFGASPCVNFYKPQGKPLRNLKQIILTHAEWESLRLKHEENLDQTSAAEQMGISQSTFQRTISSAQKKVGQALVNGWAIKIE